MKTMITSTTRVAAQVMTLAALVDAPGATPTLHVVGVAQALAVHLKEHAP